MQPCCILSSILLVGDTLFCQVCVSKLQTKVGTSGFASQWQVLNKYCLLFRSASTDADYKGPLGNLSLSGVSCKTFVPHKPCKENQTSSSLASTVSSTITEENLDATFTFVVHSLILNLSLGHTCPSLCELINNYRQRSPVRANSSFCPPGPGQRLPPRQSSLTNGTRSHDVLHPSHHSSSSVLASLYPRTCSLICQCNSTPPPSPSWPTPSTSLQTRN